MFCELRKYKCEKQVASNLDVLESLVKGENFAKTFINIVSLI
jgi:hypothetical protein